MSVKRTFDIIQTLYDFIFQMHPNVIYQFKVKWCKHKTYLPFDLCIPDLKLIIELDGIQHFKQVSNWQTPEVAIQRDIFKMKCAVKNGFSVIRLLQEDVCHNRIDWKNKLTNCIKHYDKPVIIFIEESNMYVDHIDDELRPYLIEA